MANVTLTSGEQEALLYLAQFRADQPPDYDALCHGLVARGLARPVVTRQLDPPNIVSYEPTTAGSRLAKDLCGP